MEEHARLAEDLGVEVIQTCSRDIAKTLVEIAKKRQVTQIVLGQSARSRWEELMRSTKSSNLFFGQSPSYMANLLVGNGSKSVLALRIWC